MKKRILSLLLCIVMVCSLAGGAFAASGETFSDVKPGIWFYEYVEDVADLGYFIGYPDGTFQPNGDITRAEIVLVLARMAQRLGLARNYNLNAPIDESPFEDVPTNMWYSAAIKWAADEKITLGMGNNKFAPQAAIAREDACTLICRFIDYVGENKGEYYTKHYNASLISEFVDEDQIRDYAAEAVDVCMAYGIIEGFPDGTFQPRGYWTRAQGAKMISLLHDVLDVPDEPYIPPYIPPVEDPCTIEDDLEAGKTVTLTANHTLCRHVVIPAGVEAKLDLNGYTLTLEDKTGTDVVAVKGSLTVTNGDIVIARPEEHDAIYFANGFNVDGGSLVFADVNIVGDRLWNIRNSGTLSMTNAKYTVTGGFGINNDGGAAVIKDCAMIADGEATSQIYCVDGTMNITGTEFSEGANFKSYYDNRYGALDLNYEGSVVTLEDVKITTSNGAPGVSAALGCKVYIKSGTFDAKLMCLGESVITLYDGTFCGVAYADITEASVSTIALYGVLTKGENCWILTLNAPADTRTVEEKLEAGEKVTLTADYTLSRPVKIPAGVTSSLDLGGHTLTVAHADTSDLVAVEGTLTVTNGDIVIVRPDEHDAIYFANGFNVEGGSLAFANVNIYGDRLWNIRNSGTLTMTNAKYTVTGGFGINNDGGAAVIKDCAMIADGEATSQIYCVDGTMNITGTEFSEGANFKSYYDNRYGALDLNYEGSVVTLEDVKVITSNGVTGVSAALGCKVVIKSGTFNSPLSCLGESTITLYDGTFNGVAYADITAESVSVIATKYNELTKGDNCWILTLK